MKNFKFKLGEIVEIKTGFSRFVVIKQMQYVDVDGGEGNMYELFTENKCAFVHEKLLQKISSTK